ncbi:MAG: FHA domain-containing protein [Myxococcota bacterium]
MRYADRMSSLSPYVIFQLPDGEVIKAPAGAIIGRLSTATVRIDDPRVSEAHALVSLRGSELKLLSLRGGMRVDGQKMADVTLETGQLIQLARGVELSVLVVELPSSLIALQIVSMGRPYGVPVELTRSVYSVIPQPEPSIIPRFIQGAAAHVWNNADGWSLRIKGGVSEAITPGGSWEIAGFTVQVTPVPLPEAGVTETIISERTYQTMHIVDRDGTIHVHPENRASVVLNGKPAQIISELMSMEVLAPWYVVAGEIWPRTRDMKVLRRNWDQCLNRLRRKLRQGNIRDNLVHADGTGNIELFLLPGDTVERT